MSESVTLILERLGCVYHAAASVCAVSEKFDQSWLLANYSGIVSNLGLLGQTSALGPETRWATVVLPYLLLVLIPLLALLTWWKQIYPNRLLFRCLLVPAVLSCLVLIYPAWAWLAIVADLLLVGPVLFDLMTLPRHDYFLIERQVGRIASLKKPHPVQITITNLEDRHLHVAAVDALPIELEAQPAQFELDMEPRSRALLHYDIYASRRGAYELNKLQLRVNSRFGFWVRYLDYTEPHALHVYPDMKQLSEYALLARTDRLSLLGVRRTRKVGQDNEFERLRDYTRDDNFKHIAWRSTARRNELTVKDFQANQSQRIVFMIDCGRMMTGQAAGLTLLDHALNSMLMLSYVALRQGDSVGLICFSDRIHGFVPPASGMGQMNHLLNASFDRFPQMVESRYDEAFMYLSSRARKRSLVVLITNVIDEVNANQVHKYLSTLVGKHLPLGVLLRDRQLFNAADHLRPRGVELYQAAAAADILTWRHQVLVDLQRQGVLSVDTFPEELTAPLLNQYLQIKARSLL